MLSFNWYYIIKSPNESNSKCKEYLFYTGLGDTKAEATEIYKLLYDNQWTRNQNRDVKIKKS